LAIHACSIACNILAEGEKGKSAPGALPNCHSTFELFDGQIKRSIGHSWVRTALSAWLEGHAIVGRRFAATLQRANIPTGTSLLNAGFRFEFADCALFFQVKEATPRTPRAHTKQREWHQVRMDVRHRGFTGQSRFHPSSPHATACACSWVHPTPHVYDLLSRTRHEAVKDCRHPTRMEMRRGLGTFNPFEV
jgi:hypothetical protein